MGIAIAHRDRLGHAAQHLDRDAALAFGIATGGNVAGGAGHAEGAAIGIAFDRAAEPGLTYYYRLVFGGSTIGPITVRTDHAFTEFAIGRIAPNPSTAGPLDIVFTVARDARVSLAVYDLRGRKVADLVDTRYAPGRYTARWDGSRAASGLYFVRFVTPDGEKTARVILNH